MALFQVERLTLSQAARIADQTQLEFRKPWLLAAFRFITARRNWTKICGLLAGFRRIHCRFRHLPDSQSVRDLPSRSPQKLVIPPAVAIETQRNGVVHSSPEWLLLNQPMDGALVRRFELRLDPGESAAIAIAVELGANFRANPARASDTLSSPPHPDDYGFKDLGDDVGTVRPIAWTGAASNGLDHSFSESFASLVESNVTGLRNLKMNVLFGRQSQTEETYCLVFVQFRNPNGIVRSFSSITRNR